MDPRLPKELAVLTQPQGKCLAQESILPMKQAKTTAIVAVLTGTVFLAPVLEARTCSGTGDVIGAYAVLGSRAGYFLLGATPPGSAVGGIGVTPPGTTAVSGPLIPVAVTP